MNGTESAIAGHDGTLMVQNSRDRIFFGPGEAGFEKNCKVNPRTFAFLKDLGGGSTDKFHALFSYFHMVDFTFHFYRDKIRGRIFHQTFQHWNLKLTEFQF